MGELIAFEEIARMRRRRTSRALHAQCCRILAASVAVARAELAVAPPRERWVRIARLRKLEDMDAHASALG